MSFIACDQGGGYGEAATLSVQGIAGGCARRVQMSRALGLDAAAFANA